MKTEESELKTDINSIEKVILSDIKNNFILDKIFVSYFFHAKKNVSYKILFLFESDDNINNIKLIISNKKKKYSYNFSDYNLLKREIKKYNFILDNNIFFNEKINIDILIYNNKDKINIKNINMKIIEKPILEDKIPLIIFNINEKITPIYFKENIIYG